MNNLIVSSGIIFNANDLLYILPNEIVLKTGESIVPTGHGSSNSSYYNSTETCGLKKIKITGGLFDEIYKIIVKMQVELTYKEKYDELKLHLAVVPGGTEYLLAKDDFEKNAKSSNP